MKKPADQEQRDAIRTRLDVTMMVEAAAGTGKTTNLVARMVSLVRSGRASVSEIAAITFTVKAAAQLREKFQEGMEPVIPSREDGEESPASKPKDEGDPSRSAALGMTAGFIGTTHAFCARLLRERPVEAGLDPEFEELDEPDAVQLAAAFWNRWSDEHADDLAEARELGLDRKILREAFARIVNHPDVVFISCRTERPDLEAVCGRMCDLLDEIEPNLPKGSEKPDDFEKLIVGLLRQRRSSDLDDPFEQYALLDEGNHASRKAIQKRWPDKATAKRLSETYADFVLTEVRPVIQRWREHVHGAALDVLRPAAAAFAAERRRNGTLTFADLLLCARDMLRDYPAVRRYFQRRFTHVLVDEFQDTDPLQAEVLFYLTGEDVEEKDWRKLRPRAGSLFIVGDPKQSIYRFRRADISTYLEVKKLIEAAGGKIVQLSTNFRSAEAICGFVNGAFRSMFTKADIDGGRQAPHVDLVHYHDIQPAGVYTLETPDGNKGNMAEAEAECIGRWIRSVIPSREDGEESPSSKPMLPGDPSRSAALGMTGAPVIPSREDGEESPRHLKYSDILLISWQRPRLFHYARVFERLGIPYEITGSKAFKELQSLHDALPLLRAVVDPDDEVSIVAFLRGPLNGTDDDALYRFVRAGGRFSPFRELPDGTDATISRGLGVIREGIDDARRHPPAAALARLFDRIGLVPLAASGERPGTRSGNVLLALNIAREMSSRGESLAAIVEHFEDLLESEADIEELDVDPARAEAVRMMNLHQVKGLEAPVVFLIDPADGHDFDVDLCVDRSSGQSRGHFLITRQWGMGRKVLAAPPGWDGYESVEKQFKEAEKKRLLYVAATRAKRMLVIGHHVSRGAIRGAWSELASRAKEKFAPSHEWSGGAPAAEAHPTARPFEEVRAEIRSRFQSAEESSYSVLPITKIAHANHAELVRAEEGLGKGMSWGRVLHRLFEAMLRDEALDVRLYAENLLKDEERDVVELADVMRVVEAVQGSSLWRRAKEADERYVEIPFAVEVPSADLALPPAPPDTLLHGTIDLVFREGNEWYVVDYKTDSTANRLDALTDYYTPQVRLYADFWSRLTGGQARGGLFFVDGVVERWVT